MCPSYNIRLFVIIGWCIIAVLLIDVFSFICLKIMVLYIHLMGVIKREISSSELRGCQTKFGCYICLFQILNSKIPHPTVCVCAKISKPGHFIANFLQSFVDRPV